MLDSLKNIDFQLFFAINRGINSDILDVILPHLRNMYVWVPLYVFVIAFLILNYKKNGWWLIGFLIATVALTDVTSSFIIKYSVARLRPCNNPELAIYVKLLVRCGSGFSFTSSHAANHFAIAAFLQPIFCKNMGKFSYLWYVWAGLIGFSQIYVGVHFPFDVFCGALLGILMGSMVSLYATNKYQVN